LSIIGVLCVLLLYLNNSIFGPAAVFSLADISCRQHKLKKMARLLFSEIQYPDLDTVT
jgi:hypothetical protein